jgi:hypothetical protein
MRYEVALHGDIVILTITIVHISFAHIGEAWISPVVDGFQLEKKEAVAWSISENSLAVSVEENKLQYDVLTANWVKAVACMFWSLVGYLKPFALSQVAFTRLGCARRACHCDESFS